MAQVERCQQRDGVVTARHLHPALVVRGQRTVQSGTDLQVVSLLADGRTLGLVAGQAEVIDIHGG